jgi:hypothetical protein
MNAGKTGKHRIPVQKCSLCKVRFPRTLENFYSSSQNFDLQTFCRQWDENSADAGTWRKKLAGSADVKRPLEFMPYELYPL